MTAYTTAPWHEGHFKSRGAWGRGKLTPTQRDEVHELHRDGWTTKQLADRYGVSAATIRALL